MKRMLLGAFYTLQGIGNLTFAFLLFISPGGRPAGIGFIIGALPFLASIFSLIAAFELFKKREDWGSSMGKLSSVLFIFFYGWMVRNAYDNIVRGYHVYHYAILLMVSLIIVVLNALSIFFLYEGTKNR